MDLSDDRTPCVSDQLSYDSTSCWICLDSQVEGEGETLQSFCACPSRRVHAKCLARWCLQQAGQLEEKQCRFCLAELPDYRKTLLKEASAVKPTVPVSPTTSQTVHGQRASTVAARQPQTSASVAPFVRVNYGNSAVVMQLHPGAEGRRLFESTVRQVLRIPAEQAPGPDGEKVQLTGLNTYDAAFWCGSVAAGATGQPAIPVQAPRSQPLPTTLTSTSSGVARRSTPQSVKQIKQKPAPPCHPFPPSIITTHVTTTHVTTVARHLSFGNRVDTSSQPLLGVTGNVGSAAALVAHAPRSNSSSGLRKIASLLGLK